jgi:hypothetical protein
MGGSTLSRKRSLARARALLSQFSPQSSRAVFLAAASVGPMPHLASGGASTSSAWPVASQVAERTIYPNTAIQRTSSKPWTARPSALASAGLAARWIRRAVSSSPACTAFM